MDQTLSNLSVAWLEQAPFPVLVVELEKDRLLDCNHRARELFQSDDRRLPGEVSALFENAGEFGELLVLLSKKGGVVDYKACLKLASGQRLWGSLAASLAEIEGRPVMVLSINALSVCENAGSQFLCDRILWQEVFERAGVGIAILDRNRHCVTVNDRWREMFGYFGAEVRELPFPAPASMHVRQWNRRLRALVGGEIDGFRMEIQCLSEGGGLFWCDVSATPIRTREGQLDFILCFLIDIGDRKLVEEQLREANLRLEAQLAQIQALQEKLSEEVLRDSLTGLYNRRYLEETLVRELSRAGRENRPLSLVMMDIDHFKRLNDTHGHQAGDLVLRELGVLLRGRMRGEDIACRFGGEEFVAILPGASLAAAEQRAEEWRIAFQAMRLPYEGKYLHATLSLGLANFPKHGISADELLFQADSALYMAKRAGRNRVMVCG
jgi:diguanylate cyclase (GGDEF)-like protein/PAS domain S-box-containing protein